MRRTKIVATLGPATDSLETVTALVKAGVNVFRFNFSHGSHKAKLQRMNWAMEASTNLGMPVALMLDTKGAEIRTGMSEGRQPFLYETGDKIRLTMNTGQLNNAEHIDITYPGLYDDVNIGSHILFDDGMLDVKVLDKDTAKHELIVEAQNSMELGDQKGVNAPGVHLHLKGLTDQDRDDITFGVQHSIRFIAASFVRREEDVAELRQLLHDLNADDVMIFPKIENQESIKNIDTILAAADGIMVARGDMGVEIPFQEVPAVEQRLIGKALNAGKPVITATQMLDSMQHNPRPTRAEVTDIAYAVLTGTDATMLSGESANGKYPVESVKVMATVNEQTDKQLCSDDNNNHFMSLTPSTSITKTTASAAAVATKKVNAKAIITITTTGYTTRQISRYKPSVPIIAATFDQRTADGLLISWGVKPFVIDKGSTFEQAVEHAEDLLIKENIAQKGDIVVVVAGLPLGKHKSTNNILIHRVKED